MQRIRRQLVRVASGWLVLQLATVSSVPVVLCAGISSAAADVECTCSHGDGAVCPMHHATPERDSNACSCRSTTDDGLAILASLFGETAVLDRPNSGATDLSPSANLPQEPSSHPLDSFFVPDAPPPRA
jgi:hypothetical protein